MPAPGYEEQTLNFLMALMFVGFVGSCCLFAFALVNMWMVL